MEEKQPKKEPEDMLKELENKANEYLNNWKRATADLINYKKDEVERAGLLVKYAKEDMFFGILPVLDSIYMASESFGEQGFIPIKKQIEEFLKKEGIEEIKALGEKFDPATMEIVEEVEGGESGTVAEEFQKGYTINNKVLRPARVKINK